MLAEQQHHAAAAAAGGLGAQHGAAGVAARLGGGDHEVGRRLDAPGLPVTLVRGEQQVAEFAPVRRRRVGGQQLLQARDVDGFVGVGVGRRRRHAAVERDDLQVARHGEAGADALAVDGEQFAGVRVRDGHGVAAAVRRAQDAALHGGDGVDERRRRQVEAVGEREGAQGGDGDGGRRGDAAALRHVAVHQQFDAAVRAQAVVARQHQQAAEQVRRPAVARIRRQQRARLVVVDRRAGQAEVAKAHRQQLRAAVVAARRPQPHEVVVALLDRRARRLRDRDLHRRRAGVAGEPAEHVEPARRARDQDAPVGLEEVGHRLLDQPEQHQHAEAFGGVGRRGEVLHGGARL